MVWCAAVASSAKRRLIEWANAQESWVRALAGEVIAAGGAPSSAALEGVFTALLVEKELQPGARREAPPLVSSEAASASGDVLRLRRLHSVSGVNALAAQQEIAFDDRLTVLYGENAAGKSGYVRILKRLAGARGADPVLGNFRGEASAPRAVVDYTLGGETHALEWSGEAGLPPLTRVSVLDFRAVTLHVDEDLGYVFTPPELALYRHVHEALGALKAKLDARIAEAAPAGGNPFLTGFVRDALVWPHLEKLELEALRSLAIDDDGQVTKLRERIAALRPEASRPRLQAAVTDVELYGAIASLAAALESFDAAAHAAAAERVKQAQAAAEAAADDAFEDEGIAGSNLPSWRAFLEAADRFLEDVGEKTYPSRGDDCLYCRQPLKAQAVALVKRYRKALKDSSQHELEEATDDLAERERALKALPVTQVLASVTRRVEALDEVPAVLTRTAQLLELGLALQQRGATDFAALAKISREVGGAAAAAKREAEAVIASLKKQGSERQAELDALGRELATVENRLALRARLPEIEAFVAKAKWAAAATAASNRISPVMRSLTEQSKAANEEALNQDFEKLFRAEAERLKAPPVEVEFSGRRGQAARKKVLAPSQPLSAVLSEGEQQIIALADFLAEASLRPAPAPLVFDDPVTHLDHKRTAYVAERLVQLSEARQVIVFTHDVQFVKALLDRAPAARLYGIRADGGESGRVAATRLAELG